MGVRIEAIAGYRLQLTGDVVATLDVPASAVWEGFALAFSDGTLVRGRYDHASDTCRFTLACEGAALVRIARQDGAEVVDCDWKMDWVTLADGAGTRQHEALPRSDDVLQLTLDITVPADA